MARSTFVAIALVALMAAAVSTASANFEWDYEFVVGANVSVQGEPVTSLQLADGGLQLRLVPALTGLWGKVNQGFIAASTGVNVTLFGGPLSISIDKEIDIVNLATGGPYHSNIHFNASASVLDILPILDIDVSASANLIASFPYAIVEVDANGADVAVHYIKDLVWSVLETVKTTNAQIGVFAYACAGLNVDGSSFNVSATFQTSVVAGVSNHLRANLLPRAWHHALNVTNYILQDAANSIRIVNAVATGSVDVDLSIDGQITCPYGNNPLLQAYADLNATVILGQNTTADATVTAWTKVSNTSILDLFSDLKSQLNGRFGADFGLYFANVTHPAGENNCTCTGRTATGKRLADAAAATPDNPAGTPDVVATPDATPIAPGMVPIAPSLAPLVPTPSAASSVPVTFAVAIALLAMLGMFF